MKLYTHIRYPMKRAYFLIAAMVGNMGVSVYAFGPEAALGQAVILFLFLILAIIARPEREGAA